MDENEYNLMSLEFDGMNRKIVIHSELNFIPFWAWVRNDKIHNVLQAIPYHYSIFTGWTEKTNIEKDEFIQYIKACVKPGKRPCFQVGTILPLVGYIEEEALHNELVDAWGLPSSL